MYVTWRIGWFCKGFGFSCIIFGIWQGMKKSKTIMYIEYSYRYGMIVMMMMMPSTTTISGRKMGEMNGWKSMNFVI